MLSLLTNLIPPQYKAIAILVAVAAIYGAGVWSGWKIESLRWGASETAAVTAAIDATNKANQKAVADLRAEMKAASDAALADQVAQRVVTQTVVKWKDRVINAPLDPEACRPATARDSAVLAGVLSIIAAADPSPGGTSPSAPGADSGHPTAGSALSNHDTGPTGSSDPGPGGVGSGAAGSPVPSPDLGQRLRAVIGR